MRKSRFSEQQIVAILEAFRACSPQLAATTTSTDWGESRIVANRGINSAKPLVTLDWALAVDGIDVWLAWQATRDSGSETKRANAVWVQRKRGAIRQIVELRELGKSLRDESQLLVYRS